MAASQGHRAWTDDKGETCLELRWVGHQSVIAGAHPETKGYSWLPRAVPQIGKSPQHLDWLLEPLLQKEEELPLEATSADAKRAVEMLQCIDPEENSDYNSWLRVGIALRHTDEGLLSAWVNGPGRCPTSMRPNASRNGGLCCTAAAAVTIRTLHHLAKAGGMSSAKRSHQAERWATSRWSAQPKKSSLN